MNRGGKPHIFQGQGVVRAVVDQRQHFILVAGVQDFFPAFIIVIHNGLVIRRGRFGQQVAQLADHILAEPGRVLFVKVGGIIVLDIFDLFRQVRGGGVGGIGLGRGPGAFPVSTAQHGIQLPIAVQVPLRIGEAVHHFIAGDRVFADLNILI